MKKPVLTKDEITGVVLAGGRSTRFGQNKSLYVYNGKPLVEYAIESLTPYCGKLLLSTNSPQDLAFTGLQTIEDLHKDCGPLGGIHSALAHAQTKIVVFAGCDMPFLDGRIFPFLADYLMHHRAAAPMHNGFRETLCMVIRKDCLEEVESVIQERNFKLLQLHDRLNTAFVEVTAQDFYSPKMFHNINTRADLDIGH